MPENNQVFEVAEKWELIDENGVNETLLEGFFIMHSIDGSVESHDTFIEAWEELYDVDIERWTNYAQAYLTSPNERLPSMSDYYFNNDDEVVFLRLVAIAEQEGGEVILKEGKESFNDWDFLLVHKGEYELMKNMISNNLKLPNLIRYFCGSTTELGWMITMSGAGWIAIPHGND